MASTLDVLLNYYSMLYVLCFFLLLGDPFFRKLIVIVRSLQLCLFVCVARLLYYARGVTLYTINDDVMFNKHRALSYSVYIELVLESFQ